MPTNEFAMIVVTRWADLDANLAAVHDVKGAWLDTSRRRIAAPPAGLLEASTNLPRASDYAEIVSVSK
jgi:hypothetical protein